ncbi:MAG: hypothetical protein ACKVKF_11665 [Rhodobacterales bacterium]
MLILVVVLMLLVVQTIAGGKALTIKWHKVALFSAVTAVPGTTLIFTDRTLQRWDVWLVVTLWTAVFSCAALMVQFPEKSRARKLSEYITGGLMLVAIALPIVFAAP